MAQSPLVVLECPQVRRTEVVRQGIKVRARHYRLLEHSRCARVFRRRDAQITEYLLGKALREFLLEALDQRHAFVAGYIPGAYFLRCVVSCAADAELDQSRVVVKVVDAIIDTVVLAVGARGAFGGSLKTA